MSLLFASGSPSVWASPSASVLPVNIQASLVARLVMNLPAAQGSIPCQEGPLKKGMATHFSILTQRLPWTEEPGRLQCMGSQGVRHDWATNTLCNWFVLKSGSPWYAGSKPSEWASSLFLPMFILLLEDSGLSLKDRDLGRHCQSMWTEWLLYQSGWAGCSFSKCQNRRASF